ncbi:hypothetical protein B0H10DRAFT_1943330 [Mycena sp. CBHHK59/15]|nr:hypothetical protein B0H10DRAFT_1943330 [Mycena sp. CBHHK59/15]
MTGKKPRAAAVSAKLKAAMAIATAESLEAEEPKKKQGRPKGSGKKGVQPEPEPEPEPEPKPEPPSNKGDNDKVEAVKDIECIHAFKRVRLITAIEDDPIIRSSLFPPIGSTKLSGGKPKSNLQYKLATLLFAKHPEYKDAFARAVKPKQKKSFYTKVKNKLKTMTKIAQGYIEEMGQTGWTRERGRDPPWHQL